MNVETFTFNPFQTNCYVCNSGKDAVIVDPSCYEDWEIQKLIQYIKSNQFVVKHILLTHGHIDHIFGCKAIVEAFEMSFLMHKEDRQLLVQAPMHAQMFGASIDEIPAPLGFINEDDNISFGSVKWDIVHTPGHSPGSVCFVDSTHKVLLSGDVLFYDSIGRTDLWKGSLPVLMDSIFNKVMILDDSFVLYPGHGPSTSVGRERTFNPFLVD